MREKRQQAQHRHDFELKLVPPVRHSLRERMQVQVEISDRQNGNNQKDADRPHKHIGVTRGGDEAWQMMRCGWINQLTQEALHSNVRDYPADHLEREAEFDPVTGANR